MALAWLLLFAALVLSIYLVETWDATDDVVDVVVSEDNVHVADGLSGSPEPEPEAL